MSHGHCKLVSGLTRKTVPLSFSPAQYQKPSSTQVSQRESSLPKPIKYCTLWYVNSISINLFLVFLKNKVTLHSSLSPPPNNISSLSKASKSDFATTPLPTASCFQPGLRHHQLSSRQVQEILTNLPEVILNSPPILLQAARGILYQCKSDHITHQMASTVLHFQ